MFKLERVAVIPVIPNKRYVRIEIHEDDGVWTNECLEESRISEVLNEYHNNVHPQHMTVKFIKEEEK